MVLRNGGKEIEFPSFLAAEIVYSIGPMAGGLRGSEGLREESFLRGFGVGLAQEVEQLSCN